MLTFFCTLPLWAQFVLLVILALVALKVYVVVTMGVCKSSNRLDGKTVIITGANTGIGKETALDLAGRGAKIILACRDLQKATAAKIEIVQQTGNQEIVVKQLDLSSLKSVRQFAADIVKTESRLDILINNAGCAGLEKKLTEDGLEYQMASNYFGHFLLTNLLLGLLKSNGSARIINVSSVMHKFVKELDLTNLNSEKSYDPNSCYGYSKICQLLSSAYLAPVVKQHGVTVNCLHPGVVATEIIRYSPLWARVVFSFLLGPFTKVVEQSCNFTAYLNILGKFIAVNSLHPGVVHTEFGRFMPHFMQVASPLLAGIYTKTSKQGAQTSIYLAVASEVENVTGKYFSDCKEVNPSKLSQDEGLAKKLWEISEQLVHLKPEERHF